jgi:histidine ammonia-lyase
MATNTNTRISITISNLYSDLERSLQDLRRDPARVRKSREIVDHAVASGRTIYGINTGFGVLASERIAADQLILLQKNLLLSHAVGVGAAVPREITALMLRLKIHALGIGNSGVSLKTFERLLRCAELGLVPVVPARGSVGASGDLAPLSHLCLPALFGLGEFWSEDSGPPRPAARVLKEHNLEPIELSSKDGLALINGTQLMSSYGAWVMEKCQSLVKLADLAAAMSLEGLQGLTTPFDARIQEVRPHPGMVTVAANIRAILSESEIMESTRLSSRVQDPYCLRCVPQVHGASRGALAYVTSCLETEINSVTDNPMVFDNGDVVSGGNFHGEPVALPLDFASIALAELGNISERRTYLLQEGINGLPKLLMEDTGVNSGFMIPQYTAAALVSENKVLSHPASVDSIPTCLGQEDHVSMGSISAVKLLQVFENLEHILAIELLCAAQALDFRAPLKPGRGVRRAHESIRSRIPHRVRDSVFQQDLKEMLGLMRSGDLLASEAKDGITIT